jgi:2-dehydro-3-deoxygluconokinase
MNKSHEIYQRLKSRQLIALLSPIHPQHCVQVYKSLNPLGIVLEIAFRTQAALEGIKAVFNIDKNALILAGTVMTADQSKEAVKTGVAGIVSADYIPEVVEFCVKHSVMCVPGGLSDAGKQLAFKSRLLHCSFADLPRLYPYQWIYKLFPAVTPHIAFYELSKTWQGPYKDLTVIYTGGILLSNLPEMVQHDPRGIFCGSALTKDIDQPDKMVAEARRWIEVVERFKQK